MTLALLLAAIAAAVLYWGLGWRHPRGGLAMIPSLAYLATVFFAFTWAAGVWLPPFGPSLRGVALLPFFLPWVFLGLLFATLRGGARQPDRDTRATGESVQRAFGSAFIALVAGLVAFCAIGYLA